MAKIAIDKGHVGYDSGAVGPTGLQEADVTADIVDDSTLGVDDGINLEDILRAAGHEVLVVQSSGARTLNEDLAQRVQTANAWGADLYVSVHVNCCDSSSPAYVSTWIYGTGGEAEKLAAKVQPYLVAETGASDGGIRTANFYVLRDTSMPAILCECMFISNPGQEAALKTEAMRNACARAIAAGVAEYLGGSLEPPEGARQTVKINIHKDGGEVLYLDGHIENGTTDAPLRQVVEAMGGMVVPNSDYSIIDIQADTWVVEMDGRKLPGLAVLNRGYVALRELAALMGYKTGMDKARKVFTLDR